MNDPKIVAIIPAREGSKRLPNKNKLDLCGKAMICWTLQEALKSRYLNEIIVSTDDLDIITLCKTHYPKIKTINRPKELARDDTPMYKVILHAIQNYPAKTIVVLLQPTSPLRVVGDIDNAIQCFHLFKSCISGYWSDEKTLKLNGSIYINYLIEIMISHRFYNTYPIFYVMPKERSVDVDTIENFKKCEEYLEKRK